MCRACLGVVDGRGSAPSVRPQREAPPLRLMTPASPTRVVDGPEPDADVHQAVMVEPTRRTDLGNCRTVAQYHGADLRHSEALGWLVHTATHWAPDATGEVMRRAKATVEAELHATLDRPHDDERTKWIGHWLASQSAARLRNMVDLLRTEPDIAVAPDVFDRDPLLFNVRNGTLELATGRFRPHRREDYLTKCAPVTYDPAATCPQWDVFLARVLPDPDVRAFLQRFFGYCLSGLTIEQVMVILWGSGANGKSVLLAVLLYVLGEYAMTMSFASLAAKRNEGGPRNDLARLVGARLATFIEAGAGAHFDEPVLKQLTGGDRIACRKLYHEDFEFTPTFKLAGAANHRPAVSADPAVWRRLALVPFPVVIPPEDRDTHLTEKLKAEAPGILNWLLAGWRDYRAAGGLQVPEAVRAAVREYQSTEDVLAGFLEDRTEPGLVVLNKELYAAYTAWATQGGEEPANAKRFSRLLTDRNIRQDRRGPRGTTRWLGIQLKSGGCGGLEAISVNSHVEASLGKVTENGVNPPHPPQSAFSENPNW